MIIHSRYNRRYRIAWAINILLLSLSSSQVHAASKNETLYRPDGNWNVEGANGQLYIFGSLTESPCLIAMESVYQSVDMGNIETANLQRVGDTGHPVPFHIELLDCIETPTALRNLKTGVVAWSTEQPGVKVRFLASSPPAYPQLVKVDGVQGIGLQITDDKGYVIPLSESSSPRLLSPGQDNLTYYITPMRIANDLQAGAYRALISFELIYD